MAHRYEWLLSLGIEEESVEILQATLRQILEKVKDEDLTDLDIHSLSFFLSQDTIVRILLKLGRLTSLCHYIAGCIAGVLRDQGILTELVTRIQLIDMLHNL